MEPPEHPEGALEWLDGPRLVVGAFACFLVGLFILGILLWRDLDHQVKRIDDIIEARQHEIQVANIQTVNRCFASVATAPALDRVLRSLEDSVMAAEGKQALRNFRELNELNANSPRDCRQLARKLKVEIPRGVR